MRSRLIGGPLTTTVVGPSSAIQQLTDQTDVYVVRGNGVQPVLLSLPPNPNDGDSFAVEDGAGNAAATAIGVFSLVGTVPGAQPIIGPTPGQANITSNFGGLQFTFSTFAGGWLVAAYQGGGQSTPSPALAALGNWVNYSGRTGSPLTRTPAPTPQSGSVSGTPGVIAVALKATQTGIFWVSAGMNYGGNVAADTFNATLFSGSSSGPGVLGGAGFFAGGIQGAAAANASAGVAGVDAMGGAGITFDGVALSAMTGGAAITFLGTTGATIPTPAPVGNGTLSFNYSGIVGSAAKTKVPFPIGVTVCFGIFVIVPVGDQISFANAYISAVEWPFG